MAGEREYGHVLRRFSRFDACRANGRRCLVSAAKADASGGSPSAGSASHLSSAPLDDGVGQVRDGVPFDHGRVAKVDGRLAQVVEPADAVAEHGWDEIHCEFIDQAGVEALLRNLGAGHHDLLVARCGPGLGEADRVLFRRLSVLHGDFTRGAAGGVCAFGVLDDSRVLSGLRRLVDKSLVTADTSGTVARYRMLETIRQYAEALLGSSGEQDDILDRHLDTFATLTTSVTPLLNDDKDAWRAAIAPEYENVRAAIAWGLSRDDPERGRRLAADLAWLWHLNGRGDEGLSLLHIAVSKGSNERTELQARLLTGLALVADTTRPLGLEYDTAQAALEIATEVGDVRTSCLARLLSAVGIFYHDFDTAWALADTAQAQANEASDAFVIYGAMALKGIILHLRDDHERAVSILQEAVDGLIRHGDRGVASTAIGFLAYSALHR